MILFVDADNRGEKYFISVSIKKNCVGIPTFMYIVQGSKIQ